LSSVFLSPARTGDWTWGIGPILQLPTATDEALGTGKWSAGPTLGLVYSAGPWFQRRPRQSPVVVRRRPHA